MPLSRGPRPLIGKAPAHNAKNRERDLLFSLSLDLLCVAGLDGFFRQVNPAWTKALGWTEDHLLAHPWLDFVHPDDQNATLVAGAALARGEEIVDFQNRFRRSNGGYCWLSWRSCPLTDEHMILGVARDITEQRAIEAACAASEQRYLALFRSSPIPAYVFDLDSFQLLDVSDSLVEHYGFERVELLTMTAFDIRPPGDEERLRESVAELGNTRLMLGLWQHRKKDGTIIEVEISAQIVEHAHRRAGLVLALDVTARRRIEKALRQSEERFRQMAENIGEVFWTREPVSHAVRYMSPAVTEIWQRPASEFETDPKAWLRSVHPADQSRVLSALLTAETGRTDLEYRIQRPDGTIRWIRDRAFPMLNDARALVGLVGVAEDITERKELLEKFLRAQRMESLGRLAGGIAHDLNNILTPIMMAGSLLRMPMPTADAAHILDTLEASAQRGASLVKQLLLFGRGGAGDRSALQLKTSVCEVENILEQTLPKNCIFTAQVPNDLWRVLADPTQINQVLLNLCVNANDAMPQGGKLSISAENRLLNEWEVKPIPGVLPGPYVVIKVTDSGTGIPPDLLSKIFDPFFTTKEPGKGTGLGLATVASIAKSHAGFVTVQSELGIGTTFNVGFPAYVGETANSSVSPETNGEPETHGRGEEILIVDDEEPVRTLLTSLLTRNGYVVRAAGDGVEGAAAFVAGANRIRLVLADLNMPRMDGVALLEFIRRLDASVPFLVCSGIGKEDTLTARVAQLEPIGITTFLPKPCGHQQLLRAVRAAMAQSAPGKPTAPFSAG